MWIVPRNLSGSSPSSPERLVSTKASVWRFRALARCVSWRGLWLACADALAGRGETTDSRTYRVWLWFIVRAAVVEWEGYDSGPDADRGEAPF